MHTLAIANINTALDGHFCGMLYSKTENGERQYTPHSVGEDTVASPVISQSSNCFIPGKWGSGGGGGVEETRSGIEKRSSHNLQSGHPA